MGGRAPRPMSPFYWLSEDCRVDEGILKHNTELLRRSRRIMEKQIEAQTRALREAKQVLEQEVEEHRGTEQGLKLLLSITSGMTRAKDFISAIKVVLDEICKATPWEFGELWLPVPGGGNLECSSVWCAKGESFKGFREARQGLRFGLGHGLPGRVWAAQKLEWLNDTTLDKESSEAEAERKHGLRAALGV